MSPPSITGVNELAFLLLMARQTHDGIVITDAFGRITWVNFGFSLICGYDLQEVLGRKPGSFLQGPLTDQQAVQRIREALVQGVPSVEELINYHKDGHPYWILISITPVVDPTGSIIRFVAIEHDITARKEHINPVT